MGREATRGIAEVGEQVIAKPRRKPQSNRKRALHSRLVHGTWVGTVAKTGEHKVALPDGGAAIKVRTIKRVMEKDRWRQDKIEEIRATPRTPKPAYNSQRGVKSEREMSMEEEKEREEPRGCGKDLPETAVQERVYVPRNFRITKQILGKDGYTDGCSGCRQCQSVGKVVGHSQECRSRLEGRMQEDEEGKTRLAGRDVRMQGQEKEG